MNENEFDYNGATFVAVKSALESGCERCAFCDADCVKLLGAGRIPTCVWQDRADKRNVIFIRKAEIPED